MRGWVAYPPLLPPSRQNAPVPLPPSQSPSFPPPLCLLYIYTHIYIGDTERGSVPEHFRAREGPGGGGVAHPRIATHAPYWARLGAFLVVLPNDWAGRRRRGVRTHPPHTPRVSPRISGSRAPPGLAAPGRPPLGPGAVGKLYSLTPSPPMGCGGVRFSDTPPTPFL